MRIAFALAFVAVLVLGARETFASSGPCSGGVTDNGNGTFTLTCNAGTCPPGTVCGPRTQMIGVYQDQTCQCSDGHGGWLIANGLECLLKKRMDTYTGKTWLSCTPINCLGHCELKAVLPGGGEGGIMFYMDGSIDIILGTAICDCN